MFFVDERRIIAEHDRLLAGNAILLDHLKMINASLELLADLPVAHVDNSPDQITLGRLGIRCFNSGAAAISLVRQGYWQPAVATIRDLIEVYFLLDLFSREPSQLTQWRTLSEKDREKNFKPVKVRERLDKLDGYKEEKRKQAYKLLSQQGAHVSPDGFSLISPDNLTAVGPFPDERRLKATIEELVKHLSFTAVVFCTSIKSGNEIVLSTKARFFHQLEGWRERYFPR